MRWVAMGGDGSLWTLAGTGAGTGRTVSGIQPVKTVSPITRRPLKDGFYDHSQNCVEYILLKFGPTAPTKKQTAHKEDLDSRVYMPMGEHSWMA
jgi:hypothetical protein